MGKTLKKKKGQRKRRRKKDERAVRKRGIRTRKE